MDAPERGGSAASSVRPTDSISSYLRWPPPGLERLQGDLWRVVRELFVGGLVLVLPLLWAVTDSQPFYGLGPFGSAWWILLVTSLTGLVVLAMAFNDCFRLLRRAGRAVDRGYPWRSVVLVATDSGRDTGFLLQGGRTFSVLTKGKRRRLLGGRIRVAGLLFGAAGWLPVGFVLSVLLASRGALSSGGVVSMTLVPVAASLLVALVLWAWENGVLRKARKTWYAQPWAEDLEADEIRTWKDELAERDPPGSVVEPTGSSRSGTVFRLGAVSTVFAGLFVALPSIMLVGSASVSPVLALVAFPRFSNTQTRAAEAEPLGRYRVEPDGSVSPQEAGRIVHVLENVGPTEPGEIEQPPARAYEQPFIERAKADSLVGLRPEEWGSELFDRLAELSPAAVAYLREVGGHPALEELSMLARAEGVDLAAARWSTPLPQDLTAAGFPIPRMRSLRWAGYAAIARAAVATLDGRTAEAERSLREVVSLGLLLGEDGVTLIDNLVGFVIARNAADALHGFYLATGQEARAEMLAWSREVASRAARKAQVGLPATPLGALREMPDVVRDTTAIRGIRWEFFLILNTVAPCLNVNRIVFGPGDAYRRWRDDAHASLVRYPSEEPLFDLLGKGFFGRVGEPREPGWLARAVTMTMGGAGAVGSCARMYEELTLMSSMG